MKWTKKQAEYILKVRDELAKRDIDEAYHWLYQIASPDFDKVSEEVWKDFENFSDETEDECKPLIEALERISQWTVVSKFNPAGIAHETLSTYKQKQTNYDARKSN